ncbi:hypothetical protein FDK21_20160 [Cohaesibacter sp. CAU 1516]|uniref:hypothetical protein n=1 Tax=Cohaesibacter sp. CAU 1516 TaxID=2576038 RepID=UPI0010FE30FD|nr:hypothetical protein [Cohaesibacter sp. CAU 1516]TLP42174.1 hypothetical protein FDK21_20160 [Cohaesibacter sp. CAU 1516]
MTTTLPETMTAADRRWQWSENELCGYARTPDDLNWDYRGEIIEILKGYFLPLEQILGREAIAMPLFAILQRLDIEGKTWREAFETYHPTIALEWPGTLLIDDAGIYGLYGVTPEKVPLSDRASWVEELTQRLDAFLADVHPAPGGVIDRITKLALSRRAIDVLEGELDLVSLALLGGVSEGRVRNILSSSDCPLERSPQGVTASSAAKWLKGRKEYFASIWQRPDEVTPEPACADFTGEVIFVPVAGDGSTFGPDLLRNGHYTVGAKGAEVQYSSFDAALTALHKMETPRWRRPNTAGNWGIVSGRDWKRIEKK